MPVTLDRHDYAELSTAEVPAREAFAFWRAMICATFVKLSADPVQADPGFSGRIEHLPVGDLELSSVVAGSQHVRRTRALIAHSDDDYLLASIQLSGQGRVEQDDRVALLSVGDMAFYDSTRPYTLHFDDPFHQLVVQVPKRELPLRDTRSLTARTLGRRGPGEVVPAFFTALARGVKDSPEQSRVMLPRSPTHAECRAARFTGSSATATESRPNCAGCVSNTPRPCCSPNRCAPWVRFAARVGSTASPGSTARSGPRPA